MNPTFCAIASARGLGGTCFVASMTSKTKKLIGMALLAYVTASGALADSAASPKSVKRPVNLCYCPCKATKRNRDCVRLCDLLTSQGRSWGTACRRRAQSLPRKDPQSHPHPSQQNGPETARR